MAFNLISYLKESREELKKVSWPTWAETRRNTILVIGISVFVALFLGLVDLLLNFMLEQFFILR